ncbi:polysaccharide deacetylase family protein [Natronorubrum daqingense]|uniref:Polysaccharide deacetylase n=1 Tax=Natronorubrum daqingense TaxID=588898 RepID=A0A1N6YKE8_9EURY|nr:polysaccharide deacetylase family protein [Natronorubrum daqingense]APX95636.1 polysaccharide deacetylase [Natronorubrum daqingense]SIR15088.1 Polysaccharide deacetylase [Natronorubrum daqingense]
MSQESTRRRFIGASGVGAIGLMAGCTDSLTDDGTESDDTGSDENGDGDDSDGIDDGIDDGEDVPDLDGGAVVFVYDDGPMEDYDDAFPVHEEFDAPASTGIVTEWMGREDFNDSDWMDVEHLEELVDAGWEIMSHTTAHTALGSFELVEDVEPDDERIYPEERNHGFHQGYDIEITDGEESVLRTVVDSDTDDTGGYLEFDESVGESFAAGETVERYPEDVMHEFLGESKSELESLGFEIDTLLAPYDIVDDWAIDVAREYYDGIANVNPGSMYNDPDSFDAFDTNRDYFIEFTTPAEVEADLEHVAEEEAIGIIGAHTFKEEVTAERIRETLEWVEDHDLEVLTFREALHATGALEG